MGSWIWSQVGLDVLLILGLGSCLMKVWRRPKVDPRLSQGLRLLQNKISILEDLSDHTESQAQRTLALLDKKLHEVRSLLKVADQYLDQVDLSIEKSQKVTEKIMTEIPHGEILEKKVQSKYIQAAQMAHGGSSVQDILRQIHLPKPEVELIVKVNQKKCLYESPSVRDQWMKDQQKKNQTGEPKEAGQKFKDLFETQKPKTDLDQIQSLDNKQKSFRQSLEGQLEPCGFESIQIIPP